MLFITASVRLQSAVVTILFFNGLRKGCTNTVGPLHSWAVLGGKRKWLL